MIQGSITHNEETCRRLAKIQYLKYDTTRKVVRWILGGIPIVIGLLFGADTTIGILFIVFAMFFLYKTANSYESEGTRAFQGTPDAYRHVDYQFHQRNMVVIAGGIKKSLNYSELYALVQDEEHLYLFLNRHQAHMLSIASVTASDRTRLMDLLSQRSEKAWETISTKKSFVQTLTGR